MGLHDAAWSVTCVLRFLLGRGMSAAAAAARLADRVADRRGASPRETVWPPPETVEPKPPEAPEPPHASEEPVLVAEVADDGAEDGAGPELSIDEPWEGYSSMTAAEIRRLVRQADAATVAAVRLYEAANKGRSTVLQAASPTPSG